VMVWEQAARVGHEWRRLALFCAPRARILRDLL